MPVLRVVERLELHEIPQAPDTSELLWVLFGSRSAASQRMPSHSATDFEQFVALVVHRVTSEIVFWVRTESGQPPVKWAVLTMTTAVAV